MSEPTAIIWLDVPEHLNRPGARQFVATREKTCASPIAEVLARASDLARKGQVAGIRWPNGERLVLTLAAAGALVTIDADRGIAHVDPRGASAR